MTYIDFYVEHFDPVLGDWSRYCGPVDGAEIQGILSRAKKNFVDYQFRAVKVISHKEILNG